MPEESQNQNIESEPVYFWRVNKAKQKQLEELAMKEFKNKLAWDKIKSWAIAIIMLFFAFYFFGVISNIEPEDVSDYEYCGYQYTPDNIVCY